VVQRITEGGARPFITKLVCVDPTADGDADGDLDLMDFAAFVNCLSGPGPTTCLSGCYNFDFDHDDDLDLADFSLLQPLLIAP
jgi:hypothetical protein